MRRCGQLLEETELRIAEIREGGRRPAGPGSPDSLTWGDLEMPPMDADWEPGRGTARWRLAHAEHRLVLHRDGGEGSRGLLRFVQGPH